MYIYTYMYIYIYTYICIYIYIYYLVFDIYKPKHTNVICKFKAAKQRNKLAHKQLRKRCMAKPS